ncbi:MAG: GTP-binding protein [Clostridia bacterium]|nr:GTP-binding protein [Clostridia bacterium]
MTKIDIISGFLGAGKTTLIKKLIAESYKGEKLVLVENEFGEIGIDGGFMRDAGIEISEINSGCICCSLVGDFREALAAVVAQYAPDRIIIEPSGVGKLSDVISAAQGADTQGRAQLNSFAAVVDATKAKMYMKNFGEFFNDQIEHAGTIILSRTQKLDDSKLEAVVALIREHNPDAVIITTPWDILSGDTIRSALEKTNDFTASLMEEAREAAHHHHKHHHHDHDEECCCHEHEHHHHDHDEECCCHEHEHHHHDHDEECCCHEHEHHHHDHDEECCCHEHHHHDHDEECCCHEHEHHHHDEKCCCHEHHHADEVFVNWGRETPKKFDRSTINTILAELAREDCKCGVILRAKGILPATDGTWMQFDLTPGEYEIRDGSPSYTGLLCVIGTHLDEKQLTALFGL